jgi:glycosidase
MSKLLFDIHLEQTADHIILGNNRLRLFFSLPSGDWSGLDAPGGLRMLFSENSVPKVSAQIDGVWLKTDTAKPPLYNYAVSSDCASASLTWTYQSPGEWEWSIIYTLYPDSARLERSARLISYGGLANPGFERFRFDFPNLLIGDPADCLFDAPGPFPFYENGKMVPFFPNMPLAKIAGQDLTVGSAPDLGFGLLILSNPRFGACTAGWMELDGALVNYRPSYRSDGRSVDFRFDEERACRLSPAQAISSSRQVLFFATHHRQILAEYRRGVITHMPLAPDTPPWIRDAVILEVFLKYFPDGLKGLRARLPFFRDLGINTVYIMPHWLGGYAPIDFYTVDPAYGSTADLCDVVQAAHDLGMHVLFDMVIHGFDPASPVIKAHPEFFCRGADGQIALHPEWKSATPDWVHPGYRNYMAGLARHHAETYGFDGYRVDAAAYKGPNWDRNLTYPAYFSGTAAHDLLYGMLNAIRSVNPEGILLNEVFGPGFYRVCDIAHDNMTMGPQLFLEKLAVGEATARDYKLHMQSVQELLPPGALRVYFARNHDTSWFYHFNGYTPQFLALDAVHSLLAIPELFTGDPDHGPNPDDDPRIWDFYRKLLARRKEWLELTHGEILFRDVDCDQPLVFCGLRRLDRQITLVAVSFGDTPLATTLSLSVDTPPNLHLLDLLDSQPRAHEYKGRRIHLTIEPGQVLLGRFYPR